MSIAVRFHGEGVTGGRDAGLGLALIGALAYSMRLERADDERTEVRMTFALPEVRP